MIEKVKKRNGRIEKFQRHKLLKSIHESLDWAGINDMELEDKLADKAMKSIHEKKIIDTEDIRNAVCLALKKNKHHEVCDFYSLVWLHAKPAKIRYVIKRHGDNERFSPEKLFKSVQKSFKHAHVKDGKRLQDAINDILAFINKKSGGKYIESYEIKEIVEYVLVKRNLGKVAKAYVMYKYM